ncbi:hypothetical protein PMEGAS228_09250 [Priestia megaterium]
MIKSDMREANVGLYNTVLYALTLVHIMLLRQRGTLPHPITSISVYLKRIRNNYPISF